MGGGRREGGRVGGGRREGGRVGRREGEREGGREGGRKGGRREVILITTKGKYMYSRFLIKRPFTGDQKIWIWFQVCGQWIQVGVSYWAAAMVLVSGR